MNWTYLHWRNHAQFSSQTLTRRTARPLTQTATVHLEYDLQGLTCPAVTWTRLGYICTWRSLSATRSLCWSHWKPASSLHRPPTTGPSHFTQPFVSDTVLWGWPHLDLRSPGANRTWPALHVILTTPMTSQGQTPSAAVYRWRWRMMLTALRVPVQLCGKWRHSTHWVTPPP